MLGLNPARQIVNGEIERLGNARERFHSNFVFCPFHISDVVAGQVGLFRELFLCETRFDPLGANSFTQNFT